MYGRVRNRLSMESMFAIDHEQCALQVACYYQFANGIRSARSFLDVCGPNLYHLRWQGDGGGEVR